jgi:hypothetical protein
MLFERCTIVIPKVPTIIVFFPFCDVGIMGCNFLQELTRVMRFSIKAVYVFKGSTSWCFPL